METSWRVFQYVNGDLRLKLGALKDKKGNILTGEKEVQNTLKRQAHQCYTTDQNTAEQYVIQSMADEPAIIGS